MSAFEFEASVERVAPADWPPRYRDIWADRDGGEWYVLEGRSGLLMVPDNPASVVRGYEPDEVLAYEGPLTLVRRESDLGEVTR